MLKMLKIKTSIKHLSADTSREKSRALRPPRLEAVVALGSVTLAQVGLPYFSLLTHTGMVSSHFFANIVPACGVCYPSRRRGIESQCSHTFPPHSISYIHRIEEVVRHKASLEPKDDVAPV
ncbi:hypothetical protein EVAR_33535_1 [Eumeta japonica]|uniref:Uncharacterized protein n=1 Tax=Eumeta variegata TaxID=151549 RepID=A0A4C1VIK5_EUMVA|nr:hypothetical protein EVAR_33535_1 [Eumeta japonica]